MRRNNNSPWKYLGLVIILGILTAFGWWFLSPAFIDNEVNESLPTVVIEPSQAPASAESTSTAQSVEAQPTNETAATGTEQILLQGSFYNVEHLGSGEAVVYQLADGSRILRLQNFSVENGPDLYVYLVPIDPVPSGSGSEIADFHSLGRLKGNIGDQNYDIPADLDLSQYKSVVIWCQAFAVPFSAAPLTAQ
jgi:hypothetical protein